MATLTRWSSAIVEHFTYNNTLVPAELMNPQSISIYVYDPTNTIVYTDNRPLPSQDPNFAGVAGVYEFHVPGNVFIKPTRPEVYYTAVTIAQLPDGSISGNAEIISVI